MTCLLNYQLYTALSQFSAVKTKVAEALFGMREDMARIGVSVRFRGSRRNDPTADLGAKRTG